MPFKPPYHSVTVTGVRWLTRRTFEIRFTHPKAVSFLPGQKIGFIHGALRRQYTLLGPTDGAELAICVRHFPRGRFTPILAAAKAGDGFQVTEPFGFFTYKPKGYPAVFVATGTGVAPFVAFVRAGVRDFHFLHGVPSPEALYYFDEIRPAARHAIPCISAPHVAGLPAHPFAGRVTDYLATKLGPGRYDFYLCGRNEMIRDAILIIDERFEGSRVFSEIFF